MNEKLLSQLCQDLGEVKAGITYLVDAAKARDATIQDHDKRIRKLERFASKLTGMFLLVSTAFAGLWSLLKGKNNVCI